ncbi:hypothetical protein [Streptomyces sp. CBMA152]|uniref:hypothetical protein n=1 Tax=Streptomyces sp. CBMA152 TaxID=1896312 RepID=UPI001CB70F87|nr:hypothetical protein [Streptomyces sp. CBMA152]MBD0741470.1 hypothetical protein [Streptomyces sp. CBMA152]
MSLKDPRNWARASHRAKARSRELSAVPDLDICCEAVESLWEISRRTSFRVRGLGTLADARERGRALRDDDTDLGIERHA